MFGNRRRIRDLEQQIRQLTAYIRELEAALAGRHPRPATYDPYTDYIVDEPLRDEPIRDEPYSSGMSAGYAWSATPGATVDVSHSPASASGLSSGAQSNTWNVSA